MLVSLSAGAIYFSVNIYICSKFVFRVFARYYLKYCYIFTRMCEICDKRDFGEFLYTSQWRIDELSMFVLSK